MSRAVDQHVLGKNGTSKPCNFPTIQIARQIQVPFQACRLHA
jgi:hypothetical protein